MKRKRRMQPPASPGRRDGWGRPISVDLPVPDDERLETVRGVVDRTTFARLAILERIERISREQAA